MPSGCGVNWTKTGWSVKARIFGGNRGPQIQRPHTSQDLTPGMQVEMYRNSPYIHVVQPTQLSQMMSTHSVRITSLFLLFLTVAFAVLPQSLDAQVDEPSAEMAIVGEPVAGADFLADREEDEGLHDPEPYELTWLRDGLFFAGGLGVAFLGDALHSDLDTLTVAEINALDMSDINAFDRGAACNDNETIATASDVGVISSIVAPVGLMLIDPKVRHDFGTVGAMYVETMLFATFTPSIGKGAFARIRPLIYNPEIEIQEKIDGGGESRSSFPSGHTTLAFASSIFFATVYADYHPGSDANGWVLGGSLLLASSVGYFRYESGFHFPTDIIVGAGLGSAIGFLVPTFHRTGDEHQFSLLPAAGGDYVGAVLRYRF